MFMLPLQMLPKMFCQKQLSNVSIPGVHKIWFIIFSHIRRPSALIAKEPLNKPWTAGKSTKFRLNYRIKSATYGWYVVLLYTWHSENKNSEPPKLGASSSTLSFVQEQNFSCWHIVPAALWPWGRLSLWQKWLPRISPGVKAEWANGWQSCHLLVPIVKKFRHSQPFATLRTCSGQ
jgi:hypothetical protein